jgi:hypothetical protein
LSESTRSTVIPRSANQVTALRSTPMAVAAVSSSDLGVGGRLWPAMTVCTNAVPILGSWRLLRGLPGVAARFLSPWARPT